MAARTPVDLRRERARVCPDPTALSTSWHDMTADVDD
jgi:hypothetical protein